MTDRNQDTQFEPYKVEFRQKIDGRTLVHHQAPRVPKTKKQIRRKNTFQLHLHRIQLHPFHDRKRYRHIISHFRTYMTRNKSLRNSLCEKLANKGPEFRSLSRQSIFPGNLQLHRSLRFLQAKATP